MMRRECHSIFPFANGDQRNEFWKAGLSSVPGTSAFVPGARNPARQQI